MYFLLVDDYIGFVDANGSSEDDNRVPLHLLQGL